jgi:hypothetical protein
MLCVAQDVLKTIKHRTLRIIRPTRKAHRGVFGTGTHSSPALPRHPRATALRVGAGGGCRAQTREEWRFPAHFLDH